MTQRIVCFSGQRMNGKDECANYLSHQFNGLWNRCNFGDAVKTCFIDYFGFDRQFVEEWKRKEQPPEGFDKNVRESLMFIGDGFRSIYSQVWVDTLFRNHQEDIIISDGRYFSEIDAIKEKDGINVVVWRPGFENDIDHPSEKQIKTIVDRLKSTYQHSGPVEDSMCDYLVVNNGTLEDLYLEINNGVIPFISNWYSD